MTQQILIEAREGELRAAILEEEQLTEYYIARNQDEPQVGNIYKGIVESVLPGMQAAFIDIGWERNAYLSVEEAFVGLDDKGLKPAIQDLFKTGQLVLVQVKKEAVENKGPKVSCRLTMPGRNLVLIPDSNYVAVSRKLADQEKRETLKQLAEQVKGKSPYGIIVRTAATETPLEDLRREFDRLERYWEDLKKKVEKQKAPALIHQENSLVLQLLRDCLTASARAEVIVNDSQVFEQVQQMAAMFQQQLMLKLREEDLFEMYQIKKEAENCCRRRVWLKNGGYLVFDKTEALHIIDVNTGKFTGSKNLQDTIVKMNLEAAQEVAHQIRLRNLTGIILVDFIDMLEPEKQELVLRVLEAALHKDRVKTHVMGLTHLGLVEITRKKVRTPLCEILEKECPCCQGKGRIASEITIGLKIKAELKALCHRSEAETIVVECHPLTAAYLIGENGQDLQKLCCRLRQKVLVHGKSELAYDAYHLRAVHQPTAEVQQKLVPVEPREIVKVQVTCQHHEKKRDGIARIGGYVINILDGNAVIGQEVLVEILKVFPTNAVGRLL